MSITTVSHALHGTRHVAPATRERIHAIAASLGYRPNRLASALRTQRTQTVGMLVSQLRNPLVASYVEGVESVLGPTGYGLVIANTHLEAHREEQSLALMRQLQADAVVLAAPSARLLARVWEVANERPIALINARPPRPPKSTQPEQLSGAPIVAAIADEAQAAEHATAHFIRLGHRRVALIQRGETLWSTRERLAGYRRALRQAGLPYDPALVLHHEPPQATAHALIERLLALPDSPTAAYVAPNLVGMRLVAALQDMNIPVPNRLALVVSADEDWMQVTRPRLTAVDLPGRELGAAAARLLLDRLTATRTVAATEPALTVLEAPLVIRESCGANR